jgi:hypothetical protein
MSKILAAQMKQSEFHRTCWSVTPDAGAKLEEVLAPHYWVHVNKMLRVRDQIEVMPNDQSWFAQLIVRSVGPAGPVVAILNHVEFTAAKEAPKAKKAEKVEADDDGLYVVKFGGADKWRVIRKLDNEVMSKGHVNREEAEAWIAQNLSEIA